MAKVIGPLLSQEASGQFAKSLVFNRRRGQNVVRTYTVPANPQTDNQVAQRIRFAIGGLVAKAVSYTEWTYAGEVETWVQFWMSRVKTGEVWNSALVGAMMGPANATYLARLAQYEALDDATQTLWQNAATTAIANLADYTRGTVTIEAGFMLFLSEYATAEAGYGTAFDPDVPTAIANGKL